MNKNVKMIVSVTKSVKPEMDEFWAEDDLESLYDTILKCFCVLRGEVYLELA